MLLHIVRQIYPDAVAVFIDTGLEYPEVREFALSQENVIRIKPEMNFRKVIDKYGYPIFSKDLAQIIYETRENAKNQNISVCRYLKYSSATISAIKHRCCL